MTANEINKLPESSQKKFEIEKLFLDTTKSGVSLYENLYSYREKLPVLQKQANELILQAIQDGKNPETEPEIMALLKKCSDCELLIELTENKLKITREY